MKCVRCGSKMKETDRCCLKCGAINYNNSLNASFIDNYGNQKEKERANPNQEKKKLGFLPIIIALLIVIAVVVIISKLIG